MSLVSNYLILDTVCRIKSYVEQQQKRIKRIKSYIAITKRIKTTNGRNGLQTVINFLRKVGNMSTSASMQTVNVLYRVVFMVKAHQLSEAKKMLKLLIFVPYLEGCIRYVATNFIHYQKLKEYDLIDTGILLKIFIILIKQLMLLEHIIWFS